MKFINKFQFMPFLTAAACDPVCANATVFPVTAPLCVCETAPGGLNELYFLPCSTVFSEANLTSVAFWTAMIAANEVGRSGLVIGSIGKKSDKKERISSCRPEQIVGMTWAIKAIQKCFDKTSARTHCAKANALIKSFDSFLLVARMCDGADTILPVGQFSTSDFNWTVPDNSDDNQQIELEFSWKEFGMPCTIDVAGLSGVLPKLS